MATEQSSPIQPDPHNPTPDSSSLQTTTENLNAMIGAAPIAIVAVDNAGKILYVNQKLEELFGYSASELLNNEVEMLMPRHFRSPHQQHRQSYIENPHTRSMGLGMNLVGERKDGSEFPLEAGLSTMQTSAQNVIIASIIDITVRKHNEEVLEQRVVERTTELERRRRVADALRDILAIANRESSLDDILYYIVQQAGMLLAADGCAIFQAKQATGELCIQTSYGLPLEYTDSAAHSLHVDDPVGQSIIENRSRAIPNLSQDLASLEQSNFGPYAPLHHDGIQSLKSLPLYVQGNVYGSLVLYYKEPQEFSAEGIDLGVTFADQAGLVIENALLRVQAEEAAVAEERSSIARDLHDSVTQTLFAATIIADVLPRLWERNPEQGRHRLQELHQLNRGALAEMRTLLLELRPTMLDNADLNEVLQYLVDATSNRVRLPVNLLIEGETNLLPSEVRVTLYRVTQEALNNVFKHANASEVSVELKILPSQAELNIIDNGSGFVAETVAGNHVGLRIMQERVTEIGATLTIASEPDRGTQISVVWKNESRDS